jgi:hypothetical protein
MHPCSSTGSAAPRVPLCQRSTEQEDRERRSKSTGWRSQARAGTPPSRAGGRSSSRSTAGSTRADTSKCRCRPADRSSTSRRSSATRPSPRPPQLRRQRRARAGAEHVRAPGRTATSRRDPRSGRRLRGPTRRPFDRRHDRAHHRRDERRPCPPRSVRHRHGRRGLTLRTAHRRCGVQRPGRHRAHARSSITPPQF